VAEPVPDHLGVIGDDDQDRFNLVFFSIHLWLPAVWSWTVPAATPFIIRTDASIIPYH
jgi:hypothetical protein